MTHDQPYKPARTVDEALRELRQMAGAQFDPALTGAFIEMIEKKGTGVIQEAMA
jgi:HD-GYP domain-containing protein (c-di-GMP phosphodiesterase class II)